MRVQQLQRFFFFGGGCSGGSWGGGDSGDSGAMAAAAVAAVAVAAVDNPPPAHCWAQIAFGPGAQTCQKVCSTMKAAAI